MQYDDLLRLFYTGSGTVRYGAVIAAFTLAFSICIALHFGTTRFRTAAQRTILYQSRSGVKEPLARWQIGSKS